MTPRPPVPILRHSKHGDPGRIDDLLARLGVAHEVVDAHHRPPFPDPRSLPGVIVLGGSMPPWGDDDHPWLTEEVRFIERCLETETPTLGVCLGGQLIARAAGALLYRAPEPEIGWFRLRKTEAGRSDPLGGAIPDRPFARCPWHQDAFEIPAGAAHLAVGTNHGAQAFRLGEAWATQFHFEVTAEMARDWAARGVRDGDVDAPTAKAFEEGAPAHRDAVARLADAIVGAFARRLRP